MLPVWGWDWIVLWDGLVPWLAEWHWVGRVPLQQQGAGGDVKLGARLVPVCHSDGVGNETSRRDSGRGGRGVCGNERDGSFTSEDNCC